MDIGELMATVFNVVLVVFIVATMLSAGFTTTFANLGAGRGGCPHRPENRRDQ